MREWNKTFINPMQFHNDIIDLCKKIPKDKYKFVVGIPRGGLIIAVYISHYCDLTLYDLEDFEYSDNNFSKFLIVDDIADTGKTLKNLNLNEDNVDCATLYYKPRSIIKPTYYSKEIKNYQWIVYPFEKPTEIPNREI